MNDPKHKAELGVSLDIDFQACSRGVNQAFALQGDGVHNSAALLPELINDGIRLLVYAGNAGEVFFFGNFRIEIIDTFGRYDVQLYCGDLVALAPILWLIHSEF